MRKAHSDSIAAKLRDIRKARAMSQMSLAALSGYTQGMISNYETGRSNLSLARVIRLCYVLGMTKKDIGYLLNEFVETYASQKGA